MTSIHHHSSECRALLAQITDYIDDELEEKLCAELEKHLANCDDCRVLVDTTRKTVALYRRRYCRGQVELPAGVTDRLWQALDEAGCISKF
jgi:anti-sigma factor RsiW